MLHFYWHQLMTRASISCISETKDIDGANTNSEYCPIDGKFSVKYRINDESRKQNCMERDVSLDTCPSGSTLNLRFGECSQNYGKLKNSTHESNIIPHFFSSEFGCLGHWDGPNDQKYLALRDNRHSKSGKPRYRCAVRTNIGSLYLQCLI